jgi:hypothetical protein
VYRPVSLRRLGRTAGRRTGRAERDGGTGTPRRSSEVVARRS